MLSLPARVRLVEVGPRDGLQNEPGVVPTATKLELIRRLAAAGVPEIELTSFVSPRWVPQLGDAEQVVAGTDRSSGPLYSALVPNLAGYERAMASGLRRIAVFTAASESFAQKNTHASIAQTLERFEPVCRAARAAGLFVRGYVSCALGCPYEGAVDPERVLDVSLALRELGCDEIALGDTIGVGTPRAAAALVSRLAARIPVGALAAHFHDTYGQALANLLAVMSEGVAVLDAAVAGLGGCPYAPGAAGNVASEDLVYLLAGCGVDTGIDLERLLDAGHYISQALGRPPASRVLRARRPAVVP